MFGEVRGKGLMLSVEFRPPQSRSLKMGWNLLHKLDPSLFCQAMLIPLMTDHHVLAQVAGHHLDVIKLLPSLVINEDDVAYLIRAFDAVMAPVTAFRARFGKSANGSPGPNCGSVRKNVL